MDLQFGILRTTEAGLSKARLRSAIRAGELVPLRRGWVALSSAPEDAIRARRLGGRVTAQSLLRQFNVWLHPDNRLHISVPIHASRLPFETNVCRHYLEQLEDASELIIQACLAIAHCSPVEHSVAAIDSCLDKGLFGYEQLLLASRNTLGRERRAAMQSGFGSQSGLETRIKLFLTRHRIRFEQQVMIGSMRVDFRVGQRLVIEVDGREFHVGEQFERDRRRDSELRQLGYDVMRLSYSMTMAEWDVYSSRILDVIRARRHMYPAPKPLGK